MLNPRKATPQGTIPAKLLKLSSNVSSGVLHTLFNEMVTTDTFSDNLKKADIAPAHKKRDPLDKANYRPVSVLPSISKLFEKFMQKQLTEYMSEHLSPYLCGYRKGYNL